MNPALDVTKTICTNCNQFSATGSPAVRSGSVLYLGSAGGAWAAAAFMTRSGARVATVWTRQHAGLLAATFCYAITPVANPSAAVHFTQQSFITRQATRNVLQMTWDVTAFLWVDGKTDALIMPINKRKWLMQMCDVREVTSCFPMHHFLVRYVQGGHFSSLWQLWNTKQETNVRSSYCVQL